MDWRKLTISERLRVMRKMHDMTQQEFALEIGAAMETDAYGHAERSGNIGQMLPKIIARFPEIDAGWLVQGLTGNISQATEKRLSEAYRALPAFAVRRDPVRNHS